MKTLIAYATKHGCTEKCAQILAEKLTGKADLCNLQMTKAPELARYDRVIIGGSIHIGKIQKEVTDFCENHSKELTGKTVGLYVCGMFMERAEEELNSSFPQQLLAHAQAMEFFGGEFRFKKMNFMEKLIVKKVAKVNKDTTNLLEDKINQFVVDLNNI